MENLQETAAYSFGMINGIKIVLSKIVDRINNANIIVRGSMRHELQKLIEAANEFPTVEEKGEFYLDPETGYPFFRWITKNS